MSTVYNRAFKAGVMFALALAILMNIVSYFYEQNAYENAYEKGIKLSASFSWGFPFHWSDDASVPLGTVVNVLAICIFCLVVGFVFRFASARLSNR